MQLVTNKPHYPGRCAVTGRVGDPGEEMLDTLNDIPNPPYASATRVYLSRLAVEKAGAFYGMVPQAKYDEMSQRAIEATERLRELEDKVREQEAELEAVRLLEKKYGYKRRQRAPRSDRGSIKTADPSATGKESETDEH